LTNKVTTKARAFMNNENVHVNCAYYIKVMLVISVLTVCWKIFSNEYDGRIRV